MIVSFTVPQGQERKVYNVLRGELGMSSALVRRMKVTGGICLNGQSVFTTVMAKAGDVISADVTAAEPECDLIVQDGPVDVIYEDEGLLAVNKPAGILTHPSPTRNAGTQANFVCAYLSRSTGDSRCHAVNRLDRDTSGVVLFSKNSYMKERAAFAIAASDTSKEYIAFVYGVPEMYSGVIDQPIYRPDPANLMRVIDPRGQSAVTAYETLWSDGTISLLRLRLFTGRTHQIRVHCRHMGVPLLGDILYYTPQSREKSLELGVTMQALHAEKLTFTHPLTKTKTELCAPVSRDDMKALLALVKK